MLFVILFRKSQNIVSWSKQYQELNRIGKPCSHFVFMQLLVIIIITSECQVWLISHLPKHS